MPPRRKSGTSLWSRHLGRQLQTTGTGYESTTVETQERAAGPRGYRSTQSQHDFPQAPDTGEHCERRISSLHPHHCAAGPVVARVARRRLRRNLGFACAIAPPSAVHEARQKHGFPHSHHAGSMVTPEIQQRSRDPHDCQGHQGPSKPES